ncbi:hypothetical protein ACFSL6_08905 [Paenibacillus thailandensis]|uniref:Uncharacterized protein n=1 Tax=Paenibacillus thailandensis TaxID=393250 RepID=A0ABW5QSQ2_9BACL
MAILHGYNGEVPSGKTSRTIRETFLGITALPEWLTITGAGTPTGAIVTPDQSSGGIRLTASAGAGNSCFLNMFAATGIGFQYLKEIIFEFDSLVLGSNQSDISFEFLNAAGTKGVVIGQGTEQTVFVKAYHSTNGIKTVNAPYQIINNGEHSRKRNLLIRIQSDGTVGFGEGPHGERESLVFYKTFAANEIELADIMFPKIGIKNRQASTVTCRIPQVSVTLIHN